MSLRDEVKAAERSGITISKDKLIAQLRASNAREFTVVQDRSGSFVVIAVPTSGRR